MDGDKMRRGISHKFLTIAVPYILCSVGYWVIKGSMSFAVSAKMSWQDLYMIPVRPIEFFWFLYALFFINLFAYFNARICRKPEAGFVLFGVLAFFYSDEIYLAAISYVWRYMVYFYLGILLRKYYRYLDKGWMIWGSLAGYVISVLSLLYRVPDMAGILNAQYSGYKLFCGIFASIFLISAFLKCFSSPMRMWGGIGRTAMPIYTMHVIFIGGIRIVFTRLGLVYLPAHIVVETIVPLIVTYFLYQWCICKIPFLDVFFYPARYIGNRDRKGMIL